MMQSSNTRYIPVIILTVLTSTAISNRTSPDRNIWHRAGKMTGLLLNECFRSGVGEVKSPGQFLIILQECVKERSLSLFDSTMAKDVIEILDGVEFVRYRQGNGTRNNRKMRRGGRSRRISMAADGVVLMAPQIARQACFCKPESFA